MKLDIDIMPLEATQYSNFLNSISSVVLIWRLFQLLRWVWN